MTQGLANGRALNSLFSANWRAVNDQFQPLLGCTNAQQHATQSGGYTPFICQQASLISINI